MEQATNQFTKGLQLDTHPMVQSNDTLTDCLNGTMITMNGNEVILQNDMGNRRVDKAYLPPGYEPVGMKEYGGIIYVASYNPITNKSQIGSFPSPQKKISSNTNGDTQVFDFQNFTSISGSNVEQDSDLGIDVLKSDSFMVPLTRDLNLRAGDKFAVYSEGLSELQSLLTNYNNTSGNKAYSPKNRKYTLQLGVLNSQNEFADITKTLCRWKNNNGWKPVNYNSEVSEIFKFNDGYFISDAFTNTFLEETIEDSKLIKERQKIAANTYSYKLVGPLYLKIMINHIENFNYNVYGTYDNGEATLWIEGFLTYNCPDGSTYVPNSIINSNENYANFDEGLPSSSFGFDLIGKNSVDTQIEKSIYNPNNNTYTVKIVKKYTHITGNIGPDLFEYVIGVKADIDNSGVYLRGLSVKGVIDLSLLGSGILKFNGWKFYNKDENTKLTFAFNAYPEYGKTFTNLRFSFHDLQGQSNSVQYPVDGYLPVYNGRQTISFGWEELGLQPRKTYMVTTTYKIQDNKEGYLSQSITVPETSTRWFLTTGLFNDFYSGSSGVSDFCTTNNSDFLEKMRVKLSSKSEVSDQSIIKAEPVGNIIGWKTHKIDYSYEHTNNVNVLCKAELQIKDELDYPNYVEVKESKKSSVQIDKVSLSSIGKKDSNLTYVGPTNGYYDYSSHLREQLFPIKGRNLSESQGINPIIEINNQELLKTTSMTPSSDGKSFSGIIKYYDTFKAVGETIPIINNAFGNFSDLLNSQEVLPFPGHFAGVISDFDYEDGINDDSEHYIEVATKQSSDKVNNLPPNHSIGDRGWVQVDDRDIDGTIVFNIDKYLGQIYNIFNENVQGTDITFLYYFCGDNLFNEKERNSTSGKDGAAYTRAWWLMPNGEWACFKDLYPRGNQSDNIDLSHFATFIKSQLGQGSKLVYCMYDTTTTQNDSFYSAKENYIYYDNYNIPITYTISYKLAAGDTANNVINLGSTCGNLQFIASNNIEFPIDNIEFILESSTKFYDDIHSINNDSISNVYLENGAREDSMGRALNPNYIYYLNDNNKLVRLDRDDFYVDSAHKTRTGKNRLLYNSYIKRTPSYKYQHAGSGGEHTAIYYNLLNIVGSIVI